MTVCIAALCENGKSVIMAADRMVTGEYLSITFEHLLSKIFHIADCCVIASSGDANVKTDVFHGAKPNIDCLKTPDVKDIVDEIKKSYANERKRVIIEKILFPQGFDSFKDFYEYQHMLNPEVTKRIQIEIREYDFNLQILIAGVDQTGGHIYRIDNPGTSIPHDSIGFEVIGSGTQHAMTTLISNDYSIGFSTKKALFAVYEAKKISEKAPGVGKTYTDMAIVSNQGISKITDDIIRELDEIRKKKYEDIKQKKMIEELINGLDIPDYNSKG